MPDTKSLLWVGMIGTRSLLGWVCPEGVGNVQREWVCQGRGLVCPGREVCPVRVCVCLRVGIIRGGGGMSRTVCTGHGTWDTHRLPPGGSHHTFGWQACGTHSTVICSCILSDCSSPSPTLSLRVW